MAGDPARKTATYDDVLAAPPESLAQVIAGELVLLPRPRRAHTRAHSRLGAVLSTKFDIGDGGPGGWTVLFEPELHLGQGSPDVLVPDLAAWREGRLIDSPGEDEAFIAIPPDFVCEVLSPGTARLDRVRKLPIYAREGVRHVWLVEPLERTLEVLRLDGSSYRLVGSFSEEEPLRAEPFDALAISPATIWGRST